jgi:hypothetical protein
MIYDLLFVTAYNKLRDIWGDSMTGMKGIWFTMESAIACMIIGIFLIAIVGGSAVESGQPDMAEVANDMLKGLDDSDVLRGNAAALDFGAINSNIELPGYNHTVNICDQAGTCVGPQPDASDIWVGSYFIAGKSVYQPLEIKLFVWEEE